jgi:hypothetical protein
MTLLFAMQTATFELLSVISYVAFLLRFAFVAMYIMVNYKATDYELCNVNEYVPPLVGENL